MLNTESVSSSGIRHPPETEYFNEYKISVVPSHRTVEVFKCNVQVQVRLHLNVKFFHGLGHNKIWRQAADVTFKKQKFSGW